MKYVIYAPVGQRCGVVGEFKLNRCGGSALRSCALQILARARSWAFLYNQKTSAAPTYTLCIVGERVPHYHINVSKVQKYNSTKV